MLTTIKRIEQIIEREPSRFKRDQMRRQLEATRNRIEGMKR